MKVALITAPYDKTSYKVGESLGVRYLAAALEERGHGLDLYELENDELSVADLAGRLEEERYGLVGFSVLFTTNLPRTIAVAEEVRRVCAGAHFTIGGQGTSFVWRDILEASSAFDSAVCFEGEETLTDLAATVEAGSDALERLPGMYFRGRGGTVFTGYRQPPVDLDLLPFPRRDSGRGRRRLFTMLTSRGCSARCTFCCSGNFGNNYHHQPRWRSRSAGDVVAEIDHLVERHGARGVTFVDDDFLGACPEGLPRAARFIELLGRRPYRVSWSMECRVNEVEPGLFRDFRAAGLISVLSGLDSGNARDLKLFGKGASLDEARAAVEIFRDLEIYLKAGFIMFHPLSDLAGVRDNLRFLGQVVIGGYPVLTNKLEFYAGSPLLTHFSRHCALEPIGFQFRYRIRDPRVELYRQVLRECLDPFRNLEERLRVRLLAVERDPAWSALAALETAVHRYQLEAAEELLTEVAKLGKDTSVATLAPVLIRERRPESHRRCITFFDRFRDLVQISERRGSAEANPARADHSPSAVSYSDAS